MKATRRYQVIADRAVCFEPGCSFHREGETAEPLGEAHAQVTGHHVRVISGAMAIFNGPAKVNTGLRDTPERQAARRSALEEAVR